MATLEERVDEFAFEVGTDMKTVSAAIGVLASLDTTDKTNLVNAINEVLDAVGTGGAIDLDGLTDVVVASHAAGRILRANGTSYVDVLGTDHFIAAGSDVTSLVTAASATAQGKVELATDAETITGADTARATTPANLAALFTDRIDTNVALGSSNTKIPSQAAVKAYADALIAAANGMVFKGVIDASTNPNYPAANAGDLYRISVAGKIGGASGTNVEVGDLILCTVDGTAAGTQAGVGANWNISQTNLDGAVIGPASAVSGALAAYNGTTGKLISDSGFTPSNAAIGAGSATILPTSAQVVAYAQPLDADLTAIAAVASQTTYGRATLALADDAAWTARVVAASETAQGKIEIATSAEVTTATDDARAITPLKLQTRITALFGDPNNSFLTTYQTARDS
jgi:hypothetical protein